MNTIHGNAPATNPDALNLNREESAQVWAYLAQQVAAGKCFVTTQPASFNQYATKPDTVPAS